MGSCPILDYVSGRDYRMSQTRTVSVRTRLVTAITVVAAVGLIAVGLSVYLVWRALTLAQMDDHLKANLESARFIVTGPPDDPQRWVSAREAAEDLVQLTTPHNNKGVVATIDGEAAYVPGIALDIDLRSAPGFVSYAVQAAKQGKPVIGTYRGDGVLWRFLAAPVDAPLQPGAAPSREQVHFVAAYDVDAELAEINRPARAFVIASVIVIALIAGVATLVAGRLLQPLRTMRETAERISALSLSERLPIRGHDDVSELAETMNAMLDRLDGAVDSQQQLLSDVRHELRTPLTIVRGHVELMDPTNAEEVRATRELTIEELDRMARMVQDLSATSALQGPTRMALAPTDMAELLNQIGYKIEALDGAEGATGTVAEVIAEVDAERITQAMLQLAQNATTHGGGRFLIGSNLVGDQIELWVRDYGPGIPVEDRSRIFDRFHRGQGVHRTDGSGLGLNIVQAIAEAHGGSVQVTDAPDGGAVFTMGIPIHPPASEQDRHSDHGIDSDRR